MASDLTWYVVRHGETEYNRRGLMQGRRIDAPLNPFGMAQARALADRLCDVPLDVILTSPLLRARQTAEPVADCHPDIPLLVDEDLAEMSWGELEGRSIGEVGDTLRGFAREWRNGRFDDRVGGGESIRDVEARARRILARLRDLEDVRNVLVVTHGRYLRVLLATALRDADLREMDRFGHANTGVYRLRLDGQSIRLDLRNCTSHLECMEDAA